MITKLEKEFQQLQQDKKDKLAQEEDQQNGFAWYLKGKLDAYEHAEAVVAHARKFDKLEEMVKEGGDDA